MLGMPNTAIAQAVDFARDLHLDGWLTFSTRGKPGAESVRSFESKGDAGASFINQNTLGRLGTDILVGQTRDRLDRPVQPGDIAKSTHAAVLIEGADRQALTRKLAALPEPTILLGAGPALYAIWRIKQPIIGTAFFSLGDLLATRTGGRRADFVPLPGTRRNGHRVDLLWFRKHLAYDLAALTSAKGPIEKPKVFKANEVKVKPQEWLWPNIIPLGCAAVLGGMGGIGKSSIATDIAARVSTGRPWPTGQAGEIGNVMVWEAEDDIERTVVPRLMAAEANMDRVQVGSVMPLEGDGFRELARLIEAGGGARLVVLSPLRLFFPVADPLGDLAVREALQPLIDYAVAHRMTFLGIMHPPKDKEDKEAFGGPAAYVNLPRAALSCTHDPADSKKKKAQRGRILTAAKGNLGPDTGMLRYTTVGVELPNGITSSRISWLPSGPDGEPTERRMIAPPRPPVADWLTERLTRAGAAGVEAAVLEEEATQSGYSRATLYRAHKALNVYSQREGNGPAKWFLNH